MSHLNTYHPVGLSESQAKARRYAAVKLRLSLLSLAVDFLGLLVFLLAGWSSRLAQWSASTGIAGRHYAFVVLIYALLAGAGLKVIDLPLDLLGRRVEMDYEMDRQGWMSWAWDEVKSFIISELLMVLGAEAVYWLLRASPVHWWLWAWAVFTLFTVVLAQLAPVILLPLFHKFRRLSNNDEKEGALVRRLEATYADIVERAHRSGRKMPKLNGIFEWKLGEKSAKANAALTGWGKSRRVIISDTLLADSPPAEIEAVFVHELGHHVHHDIWRGLGFQTALTLAGFWLAQIALDHLAGRLGLNGIADVAGLPLLVLVFMLLGLALMPVSNGFSREMERRADDYSFEELGTAAPLMEGLSRLAEKNLAEVEPAGWKEWLLYSHPSIGTRLRRGRAFEEARAAKS